MMHRFVYCSESKWQRLAMRWNEYISGMQASVVPLASLTVSLTFNSLYRVPINDPSVATDTMKIFYFGALKFRAETPRLVMNLGGQSYENVSIPGEQWRDKYKPMSPSGQCPWMELDDGTVVTQSNAISQYCASEAGMLPSDPIDLARTTELQFALEEMVAPVVDTFMTPADEKVAARQALCEPEGKLTQKLKYVDKIVGATTTEYFCGDQPTLADYHLFVFTSFLRNKDMFEGIDPEFIDSFENLAALRSKVASLDKVKALYTEKDTGFKPSKTLAAV